MFQCGILHVSFFQDQPPSLSLLGSSTITAVTFPIGFIYHYSCLQLFTTPWYSLSYTDVQCTLTRDAVPSCAARAVTMSPLL